MSDLLHCERLTKKFGNTTALNSVDLTLQGGKRIGLLGPNGSGKTTLLKLAANLLVPTEGIITVDGRLPGTETKKIVSFLPDNLSLFEDMSGNQIVGMFSDFYEDFRSEKALQMINELSVDPSKKLKTLSKGTKEKVALILAMSRNAKLYLLDEPIAGVDPAARDYIIHTILELTNPESSVLISTHLISDIEDILDDVIFLKNGSVVRHESAESMREAEGKSVDECFREVFRWDAN